jgi:ketosteroid isomerase-like protein
VPDASALARLIDAIEAGDLDAVRDCYHPDARIWHNNDGVSQTVEESLRVIRWMTRALPVRRYVEVRRFEAGDRLVQQHVLEVDQADGAGTLRMPACIIVTLADDGRIALLEEYLDPAAFAPITSAARQS